MSGSFSTNSVNDGTPPFPWPRPTLYKLFIYSITLEYSVPYPPQKNRGNKEAAREDLIPQIKMCNCCSTWISAQCYMPAWMGGWIHPLGEGGYIYMYTCSPETTTQC